MNRRDAIARLGLLFGGTLVGAEAFLSGCARRPDEAVAWMNFSPETLALLDEVGETILPTTASSAGARAAAIGEFMKVIVSDCYEEDDQKIFVEGIGKLNEAAASGFGGSFTDLSHQDRHQLLLQIDREANAYNQQKKADDPNHYFTLMKQLTLWGYFTSEVGATQALRYLPVPGRYDGCVPYKKGDRAWADT